MVHSGLMVILKVISTLHCLLMMYYVSHFSFFLIFSLNQVTAHIKRLLPHDPHEEFTITLSKQGFLTSSPDHAETAFSFELLNYFKVLSTFKLCKYHSIYLDSIIILFLAIILPSPLETVIQGL